eukprot:jgi/Orpsp1_1/1185284/evm.model.c7180000093075.1
MNNFRIFANPNKYLMKLKIDGYNDDIKFNFDDIEINVLECNNNQIKKRYKNGILYCENPDCGASCPIDVSAICIFNKTTINDINNTVCKCLEGWD